MTSTISASSSFVSTVGKGDERSPFAKISRRALIWSIGPAMLFAIDFPREIAKMMETVITRMIITVSAMMIMARVLDTSCPLSTLISIICVRSL